MPKSASGMKIVVSKDGPYLVSGNIPLKVQIITPNKEGLSWDWKDGQQFQAGKEYNLCRCGHSKNKPFCDNSHLRAHFQAPGIPFKIHLSPVRPKLDAPMSRAEDPRRE